MEKQLIKTADLTLSSTLLCLGCDVLGIDATDNRRIFFFFNDDPSTRTLISDFWGGKIKVNPLELANSRRELLTRIHEETGK